MFYVYIVKFVPYLCSSLIDGFSLFTPFVPNFATPFVTL